MNFRKATAQYEEWLSHELEILPEDLDRKHELMREGIFPFLRATFYRWSQLWDEACPDLAASPALLAVGDLHVENFGTWRDAEGRLVWGINDFDEAARMPYTIDLVRLAASAILARADQALTISAANACAAILKGYRDVLDKGGVPFVLEEDHPKLRQLALGAQRDPGHFWAKSENWKVDRSVPKRVRTLITRELPKGASLIRVVHRVAGLGSLGRRRYVALASWRDGMVAREGKQMVPSAYRWVAGKSRGRIRYDEIMANAVRCPDPFVRVEDGWLLRRLGPHCSRIELADLPTRRDEQHLLEQMGRETANIHLGSPDAIPAVKADLVRRKPNWLLAAAETMARATKNDFKDWKAGR